MKILIVSGTKKVFSKEIPMRWHMLPHEFIIAGHEVKYLLKKDWWKYPFVYLSFRPDVVIGTGLFCFIPSWFYKLKIFRKPLIFDWNDVYHEVMGKKYSPAVISFIELFNAKNSTIVITPSMYLKKKCDTLGINSAFVEHGSDLEKINLQKNEFDTKFNVLYVGEISEYKGIPELIDATKSLSMIDLYLIGPNSIKDLDLKNKRTHYLGIIPKEKINSYLQSADILVLANDQDSALKMYDYIKIKGLILAKRGRVNYILEHKFNAYTCDDFKNGILELYNSPELRKEIKGNIAKFKVTSWKEIAEKYINTIERL